MTSADPQDLRPKAPRPTSRDGRLVAPSTNHLRVPYFTAPIATSSSASSLQHRRILLLSYHFPPSPEAGALRWQKLASLVAERGWGLDVVALDPAQLNRQEPERYYDLPGGTRLFGVTEEQLLIEKLEHQAWRIYRALLPANRKPARAAKDPVPPMSSHSASVRRDELAWDLWQPRGWRRAYYAWVRFAHDRAWARRAASLACSLAEPAVHRLVISCGPPHVIHEGGRLIAETTGLPFVVDMRDPWSLELRLQDFAASPLYLRLATTAERRIVDRASLVVMNTPQAAEVMAHAYPGKPIVPVLNGYDEEPLPPIPPRIRFLIAYSGSIYLDRDPRLVFRAGARVVRELALTPAQFGFEFVGNAANYGGSSLEDIAAQEGLAGYVRTGKDRPRAEARAFLAQAIVLLTLPQDSTFSIPSKIYEYMQFPAWLLALTESDSATHRILADTGADVVRPNDVNGMADVLRRRYQAFAAGERPAPIRVDPRLSRRHQADLLLEAIARVTGAP